MERKNVQASGMRKLPKGGLENKLESGTNKDARTKDTVEELMNSLKHFMGPGNDTREMKRALHEEKKPVAMESLPWSEP